MDTHTKRRIWLAVLVILAVGFGITDWYKLDRDVPQPQSITGAPRSDFLYGSVGAEQTAGIPYWIWLVLPRICKDEMPDQGGYAALGRPWDEGVEMPAGFAKKTVGYVRVAGNCALCHAASSEPKPDEVPKVILAAPGHATDPKALLAFFQQCAASPHYNAGEILSEIGMATKLSLLDQLLYRLVLIPRTRKALLEGNAVLIDSELQSHSQHPGAPFTGKRRQNLAAWLKSQTR
jgi:hypothetical protein